MGLVETWFNTLRRSSHKQDHSSCNGVIGVLAFEVASLMSKLVQLWQSLKDEQVRRLREDMMTSVGIKKLVSDDDDYIVRLICAELTCNLGNVAKAVARMGKKCGGPSFNSLDHVFNDLILVGCDRYGLEFTWKKMETKVKKMERHVSLSASLYQEMELLSELEQTLNRMSSCTDSVDQKTLQDYRKKIARKRLEVKSLQECSLWGKSYDYSVSLMVRSVFTIFGRIKYVFGIDLAGDLGSQHPRMASENKRTSHTLAALMQSSVHPSENNTVPMFSSGPLWKATTPKEGPSWKLSQMYQSFSGPLGGRSPRASQYHEGNKAFSFHSGPLAKSSVKSNAVSKTSILGFKLWASHKHNSTSRRGKYAPSQLIQSTPSEASFVCNTNGTCSPVAHRSSDPYGSGLETPNGLVDSSVQTSDFVKFNSKWKLVNPPPETLGAAALALQYSNIIIVIEKLAASPHLIGQDARDDLYSMLPSSIRCALREKLRPSCKSPASSVYLADEWGKAMSRILEWLAPLAHNMIRWHTERSYEQQSMGTRTSNYVLLVQTLYYADKEKTEDAVTELLVGLNYVWRFGREVEAKAFLQCNRTIKFGSYLNDEDP